MNGLTLSPTPSVATVSGSGVVINGASASVSNTGTITSTGGFGVYITGNTGTLVSFFCIPATKAPAINTTAGLPGPGALSLPAISVRAVRQ